MQRFSVSVDEELAAWIEEKADERGVSKAKVIRDAIETAQVTGLVRDTDVKPADAESLLTRIEMLENRVDALEAGHRHTGNSDSSYESVVSAFKTQLHGQPPTTEHGREAVGRVFSVLLSEGPLRTKELKEQLYPEFESEFESADSMWQSIQRYFDDIAGIEKVGHGQWDANPDAVDSEPSGLTEWSDS